MMHLPVTTEIEFINLNPGENMIFPLCSCTDRKLSSKANKNVGTVSTSRRKRFQSCPRSEDSTTLNEHVGQTQGIVCIHVNIGNNSKSRGRQRFCRGGNKLTFSIPNSPGRIPLDNIKGNSSENPSSRLPLRSRSCESSSSVSSDDMIQRSPLQSSRTSSCASCSDSRNSLRISGILRDRTQAPCSSKRIKSKGSRSHSRHSNTHSSEANSTADEGHWKGKKTLKTTKHMRSTPGSTKKVNHSQHRCHPKSLRKKRKFNRSKSPSQTERTSHSSGSLSGSCASSPNSVSQDALESEPSTESWSKTNPLALNLQFKNDTMETEDTSDGTVYIISADNAFKDSFHDPKLCSVEVLHTSGTGKEICAICKRVINKKTCLCQGILDRCNVTQGYLVCSNCYHKLCSHTDHSKRVQPCSLTKLNCLDCKRLSQALKKHSRKRSREYATSQKRKHPKTWDRKQNPRVCTCVSSCENRQPSLRPKCCQCSMCLHPKSTSPCYKNDFFLVQTRNRKDSNSSLNHRKDSNNL